MNTPAGDPAVADAGLRLRIDGAAGDEEAAAVLLVLLNAVARRPGAGPAGTDPPGSPQPANWSQRGPDRLHGPTRPW
jgi:hypothetical protein